MLISNDFQVAKVLKRGFELYKLTFKDTVKYSLLAILLTRFISIYMYFLELMGRLNEMAYAIGLVLLVFLLVPLVYFTVRVVAATVGKLKAQVSGNNFDYKKKFNESKELFWRLILVFTIRLFLGVLILLMGLLIIYFIISYSLFKLIFIIPLILILLSILFVSLLLLFKLEFAAPIIYWKLETEYSDTALSARISKHYKLKKLFVVLWGHLPNLLILLLSFYISKVYNGFVDIPLLGFMTLVLTITLNTITFSWMYSFYIALFEALGAFGTNTEDIEWLSF